jgi:hypothetical protein
MLMPLMLFIPRPTYPSLSETSTGDKNFLKHDFVILFEEINILRLMEIEKHIRIICGIVCTIIENNWYLLITSSLSNK